MRNSLRNSHTCGHALGHTRRRSSSVTHARGVLEVGALTGVGWDTSGHHAWAHHGGHHGSGSHWASTHPLVPVVLWSHAGVHASGLGHSGHASWAHMSGWLSEEPLRLGHTLHSGQEIGRLLWETHGIELLLHPHARNTLHVLLGQVGFAIFFALGQSHVERFSYDDPAVHFGDGLSGLFGTGKADEPKAATAPFFVHHPS